MSIDRDVVVARLTVMRDLLDDLESLGSVDAARLGADRITRHAVERMLTQLVEQAVSINTHLVVGEGGAAPATYRESFAAAARAGLLPIDLADRLAPSAGLRNVLTHEYVGVDLELVAVAVGSALVDYRAYVAAIATAVLAR